MTPNDQKAFHCNGAMDPAWSEAQNLLDEYRALLAHVGSPGVMTVTRDPFATLSVNDAASLAHFLDDYFTHLLPSELNAIVEASEFARRGQTRELIALDNSFAESLARTPFTEPSRQMGRLQLARLRPLRDDRLVQRYLAAVEAGKAHGWHTLVYGVTLAAYSLPTRQGLLFYAHETLAALAGAARRGREIHAADAEEIVSRLVSRVPDLVETAIAAQTCRELIAST